METFVGLSRRPRGSRVTAPSHDAYNPLTIRDQHETSVEPTVWRFVLWSKQSSYKGSPGPRQTSRIQTRQP